MEAIDNRKSKIESQGITATCRDQYKKVRNQTQLQTTLQAFFNLAQNHHHHKCKKKCNFWYQGKETSSGYKTFGTKKCLFCMKERTFILKRLYVKTCTLINNNSEIYGTCRHKMTSHRFTNNNLGTDEFKGGQKSQESSSSRKEVGTRTQYLQAQMKIQ